MGCITRVTTTSVAIATMHLCCMPSCSADEVAHANTRPQSSAGQQEQYFDMFEIRVLGNTRLPQRDIESLLYPFLGEQKTLQDVEAARKALETLYHNRGYGTVYVDIPEQTVDGGIIRLAVTEARLEHVHVSGARYFSNRQIRAALPEATPGTTPSLPVLQQQVNDLNQQTSDRQVVPVLKAGSVPGTVDLSLKVDDHLPLHATLDVNDQYTADTTPLRAALGLSYNNLFGRLDTVAVQYQYSPQNLQQVKVWLGSYTTHVFDDVTRLSLIYVDSRSGVATLGSGDTRINVLGKGKTGSVRLIHPLAGLQSSLGSITFSADYKNSLQNICNNTTDIGECPFEQLPAASSQNGNASTSSSAHLDYTPINYINFSLGYSGGWRGDKLQGTFSLSGNFGIRGLRNNPDDFENKRFLANSNYIIFRSDGMLMNRLPADFNVTLKYSAQYAFDPVIQNEQLSLTGIDGSRSYLESEILVDRGIRSTLQFGTPQWKWFKSSLMTDAFVFYDYATGQIAQPLQYEAASHSVSAAGIGFNFILFDHFNGNLFWSRALRDGVQTRRGDSRYQFDVSTSW